MKSIADWKLPAGNSAALAVLRDLASLCKRSITRLSSSLLLLIIGEMEEFIGLVCYLGP